VVLARECRMKDLKEVTIETDGWCDFCDTSKHYVIWYQNVRFCPDCIDKIMRLKNKAEYIMNAS